MLSSISNLVRGMLRLDRSRRDRISADRLQGRRDDEIARLQQLREPRPDPQVCPACGGARSCPLCGGHASWAPDSQRQVCNACGGRNQCSACGGTGQSR
jgi:hypothetical protein